MPAAAAMPLMIMTLMPVDDDGSAGDPLVVALQLGNHGRRENQHERRARDAEAQQVDRLQHRFGHRSHAAAHVDGGHDGDQREVDRSGPARAGQRAMQEVRLEPASISGRNGGAQPLARVAGSIEPAVGEPGFARSRTLHDDCLRNVGDSRQVSTAKQIELWTGAQLVRARHGRNCAGFGGLAAAAASRRHARAAASSLAPRKHAECSD